MGRRKYSNRYTTEECLNLSIFSLKRDGCLQKPSYSISKWSRRGETVSSVGLFVVPLKNAGRVRFSYKSIEKDGEEKDMDYKVKLVTTPCNYGGFRYWFMCPQCTRRTGVIHLPPTSFYFKCRKCLNLTYHSRRQSRKPLHVSLDAMFKAEELGKKIKTRYYAGKPTRKQRRIDKLYERFHRFAPRLDEI